MLGLTGCDNDSNGDLQAVISPANRIDTTGMVHLDINDSTFGTEDDVMHSVTVSDAETGEIIHQLTRASYDDINNGHIAFSPFHPDLELDVVHRFERRLSIEYTIEHINGATDTTQQFMEINTSVLFGRVGKRPVSSLSRSFDRAGSISNSVAAAGDDCVVHCTPVFTPRQVSCKVDEQCQTLLLIPSENIGNESLLEKANQMAEEHGFDEITEQTSVWLQASGGYGGRSTTYPNSAHGGVGGIAQTVTTLEDIIPALINPTSSEPIIHYYVANSGTHGNSGSGGPATLVAARLLNSPVEHIDELFLVAGGGGGGGTGTGKGKSGHGGLGGVAIATTDRFAVGVGASGGGKGGAGGGGSDPNNPGPFDAEGGNSGGHSGQQGWGGDSGRPLGWANNTDFLPNLGSIGQGGGTKKANGSHGGGGGGGFGGGGSGRATRNNYGGGGAGAGSYAKQSTYADHYAPKNADDVASLGSTSGGWFRFVFNVSQKKNETP